MDWKIKNLIAAACAVGMAAVVPKPQTSPEESRVQSLVDSFRSCTPLSRKEIKTELESQLMQGEGTHEQPSEFRVAGCTIFIHMDDGLEVIAIRPPMAVL